MFYLDRIGLGEAWNECRGRARIGGATFDTEDAPDAIRISCTAGLFRAIVREYWMPERDPLSMEMPEGDPLVRERFIRWLAVR
jgi:hypothetical protein